MGLARRRARLAVSAVAVLTLGAACSSAGEGATDPDTSEVAAESTTTPGASDPTGTTASAVHTVEPPEEWDGRLYGDDLLIVDDETLPDELVEQIARIKVNGEPAIAATEQLSVSSFALENKSYRIAAVDLAGYRRFTPQESAATAEQWERVAGGEVAISPELQDRLPLDDAGYLEVGSGEDTRPIHVGAYAPQAGTIDVLVNAAWGETLGLPADNALLIHTGGYSPQAVRDEIEKLTGNVEITNLDAVEEFGLDLDATQSVQFVGTFSEAVGNFTYTPIGGGRVAPDPAWVRSHIVTESVPILGQVTCNRYMMPQLRAALAEIQSSGLAHEIHPDEYAGCYYPRFIAGSSTLSNHSFGLALDLNVPGNQRGTVGEIHRGVVAIFKKWGFAWGGDWSYTDPMHFELEEIVNPR